MPVFLMIPLKYCLNCIIMSLRLDVSNCDSGLEVHALEATINLLPCAFLGASNWLIVISYPLVF